MGTKMNLAVFAGLIACLCLAAAGQETTAGKSTTIKTNVAVSKLKISAEGQTCLDCHTGTTPVLVQQWQASEHAKRRVDCYSCHKANLDDPAAFDHYGQKIAVIVTPKYCARCHLNYA